MKWECLQRLVRTPLACFFLTLAAGAVVGQRPQPESDPLAGAEARIEKIRKADAVVRVVDRDGVSVSGVKIKVEQIKHAFLFGCNAFPLLGHRDPQKESTYQRAFSALFNYATLGFYWGAYERQPGKTDEARLRNQAVWCQSQGIAVKGHPLVWHEVYPTWGPADAEGALKSQQARVSSIVSGFAGLIDRWDVVNEATVSDRFTNGIGLWAKRDGAHSMVADALEWAKNANPRSTLLYNDYNLSTAFETLLMGLAQAKQPPDAIGIQSHMHQGEWSLQKAWRVCETYARFEKPLHFTELTVLSGEHGWERPRPWLSTPEGESRQADYVEKLYTLLFSHPAVKAVTWWDFADGAWQGAPAGLVNADLSPKPAYNRLRALIKGKWWTSFASETDSAGEIRFRGFLGDYRIMVTESNRTRERTFRLEGKQANVLTIRL